MFAMDERAKIHREENSPELFGLQGNFQVWNDGNNKVSFTFTMHSYLSAGDVDRFEYWPAVFKTVERAMKKEAERNNSLGQHIPPSGRIIMRVEEKIATNSTAYLTDAGWKMTCVSANSEDDTKVCVLEKEIFNLYPLYQWDSK